MAEYNGTAYVDFVEGCPLQDVIGGKSMPFKIFRVGDHLSAKPMGLQKRDKKILHAKTLKPHDIWKLCSEFTKKYWESQGFVLRECVIPTKKKRRALYTKKCKQRTWELRKELIRRGVVLEK